MFLLQIITSKFHMSYNVNFVPIRGFSFGFVMYDQLVKFPKTLTLIDTWFKTICPNCNTITNICFYASLKNKNSHILSHIKQWTKNDIAKYINSYFEQFFKISLFGLIDLVGFLLH